MELHTMKEDEKWLLVQLLAEHNKQYPYKKFPREIISQQKLYNQKRLWYVMEKFDKYEIVEYGTSLNTAWLTNKGLELAKKVNDGTTL